VSSEAPARKEGFLISGGTVLTVDASDTVLHPGWVRTRGGLITEVSSVVLSPEPGEDVIDAAGAIVMPGMVNTHSHLFQILLRSIYDERPLSVYLDYIYRSGVEMSPEAERSAARLAALEAVRAGVTTIVDHHFLNRSDDLAAATIDGVRSVGMRAVLARTILDMGDGLPPAIVETPERGLAAVDRLRARYREEISAGLVDVWTGPNTPGVNASAEAAIATREYAESTGTRRSAHVAEYKGAVEAVLRRYGYEGVVEWLNAIGALGPDLLAVHSVQVRPTEIEALARSGAAVSHNPFSNLFCGDRTAPVSDYLSAGMAVGLGTDGDANNDGATILDAARITRLLQRLHPTEPAAISQAAGVRMCTAGGASAIGMADRIGSVEAGKRADLVILDLGRLPHSVPVHDPLAQLVHSARPSDTRTVLIEGRAVMRDRRFVHLDEDSILEDGQRAAAELVARLG
jgi:5-methylthioadenosine/S-adenosylhomocysteine deaminase